VDVKPFMGGFIIVLTDGKEVVTENHGDALELEKFKGTDHKLRLTYLPVTTGEFVVAGFEIAD